MVFPSTYDYRRERLEKIRREAFDGSNKEMARTLGLNPTHLSSYIKGRQQIGSTLARNIEIKLKLRTNELDQPIFDGTTYEAILKIKKVIDELPT